MIFNRKEPKVGSEEEIQLQGQKVYSFDTSDSQATRTPSYSWTLTPFQPFSDVEQSREAKVSSADKSDSLETSTRTSSMTFTPFQPFSHIEKLESGLDFYIHYPTLCHRLINLFTKVKKGGEENWHFIFLLNEIGRKCCCTKRYEIFVHNNTE